MGETEPTPAAPLELPRLQWAPPQEVPLWDINCCILEDGQILIPPEEEVHTIQSRVVLLLERDLICVCVCVCPFAADHVDPKPRQQLFVQPQHAEPR